MFYSRNETGFTLLSRTLKGVTLTSDGETEKDRIKIVKVSLQRYTKINEEDFTVQKKSNLPVEKEKNVKLMHRTLKV